MASVVQQLRTTDATKIPGGLEPGQIALNLANHWLCIGDGSADISVDGTNLAYGTTATVLGVASVVIPAKPAAGKGYYIASGSIDGLVTTIPGVVGSLPAVTGLTGATDGTYIVNPTGGTGTGLQIEVTVAGGTPTYRVVNGGTGYADTDAITIPSGQVTGATADGTFTLGTANIIIGFAPAVLGAGILIRDPNVADGAVDAWKLVRGLDCGSF